MPGMISDIQPFSLHDGPGIRTTVFLKGCNMRCLWCHNPETFSAAPEILYYKDRCIGCQSCRAACASGPLAPVEAGECSLCMACSNACPSRARQAVGLYKTADEVFIEVAADAPYYLASGGGVTLSGGEPLLQAGFVLELLERCKAAGIHTAVETNLSVPFQTLTAVLPYVDLLMFDVKLADDEAHTTMTGLSNRQVLENMSRLDEVCLDYIARTPLIPGITDTVENITAIASLLKPLAHLRAYELLGYNVFAPVKYAPLGKTYPLPDRKEQTAGEAKVLLQAALDMGINARYVHLPKNG